MTVHRNTILPLWLGQYALCGEPGGNQSLVGVDVSQTELDGVKINALLMPFMVDHTGGPYNSHATTTP